MTPADATAESFDLDAYFARIGYTGPAEPTLDVLRGIQYHHATTIPFENLDVLLGHGIRIDTGSVQRKLVHARRGGYCFEQNTLLLAALTHLGFQVTPLSGRVRLGVSRDVTPPRTHLFLRVEIDGETYVADCGVGGVTPASPLRFVTDLEQPTPHETRRFVRDGSRFFHQLQSGHDWTDVYEFTGETMPPIDRTVANHFTSSHPDSKFRNNLMAALARPDGTRHSLLNNEFTHRRGHTVLSTRVITSADELLEVLAETFGLNFPPGTRFGHAPSVPTPWPT